jgi:hypothetical protein
MLKALFLEKEKSEKKIKKKNYLNLFINHFNQKI